MTATLTRNPDGRYMLTVDSGDAFVSIMLTYHQVEKLSIECSMAKHWEKQSKVPRRAPGRKGVRRTDHAAS